MEALARQVSIGGLWNLTIYGKIWSGPSTPDLPGQRTLHFWKDSGVQALVKSLILWFHGCLCGRGKTLVSGTTEGQNPLLSPASAMWLAVVVCCLWKTTQYFVWNSIRPLRKGTAMGNSLEVTQTTKSTTTIWSSNPTSGYLWGKKIEIGIEKTYLLCHVHGSIFHNSHDVETT